ncbi:MAG: tyrosine-protein phosphatase [Bacteroidia bacterium]
MKYINNFRDISFFNPLLKKGLIFRTSTLSLFPKEQDFQAFLQAKNITQIIDLRAEREVLENSYSADNQQLFKYIHAPFDPWVQSVEFQNTHNTGTNAEIAYRFFMLECQNSIKKVMESLAENEGATAIHCHAGKDRTGIIAIFLHLLAGADYATILQDYLASEMDTSEKLFQIVWNEVEKKGGIYGYLQSCNLSLAQIQKLEATLLWKN